MDDAFKMLERIADKAAEPLICDGENAGKTVGAWRHEMAELITEAMWYVAIQRRANH